MYAGMGSGHALSGFATLPCSVPPVRHWLLRTARSGWITRGRERHYLVRERGKKRGGETRCKTRDFLPTRMRGRGSPCSSASPLFAFAYITLSSGGHLACAAAAAP